VGLFLAVPAFAIPQRPVPQGPVNDFSGILSAEQKLSLQRMLVDFADSTSNQICVVITDDLEGCSADEYAIRIGLEWKVGSAEFDNGIVFLIKPKPTDGSGSGDAFIAVGRGLEGAIPDAVCYRILSQTAVPFFRRNDYSAGVEAVCLELMQLCEGEYHKESHDDSDSSDIAFLILFFIILIAIIVVVVKASGGKGKNNRGGNGGFGGRGMDRGIIFGNTFPGSFGSGGSSGSFGGFGGGFSGGFGGGSFGGGGAGTRW